MTRKYAPSIADIEALAYDARMRLPPAFIEKALEVAIRVENLPGAVLLAEMDIEDPFELTAVYEGIPLTHKSVTDQPFAPDTVTLFRRPILDEWASRGDVSLPELVGHIVVHEFAHHFGWSDEDIAQIDRWWE
ncbi:metallopeptidase family protein [Aliiroseovarius sediminis]|uniref:metallopeptidase family protein n=1 Tax=Aliiroseovarius sediminis TaxID=2925839 RepID=UPI001F5A5409|nr:metallopeptidase family protein [Aliiroseovarius sediminis]MCI2394242.1 metallopeptidase family protein [Aliiroseovarius sediminis]